MKTVWITFNGEIYHYLLAYIDMYDAGFTARRWAPVMELWSLIVFALWNQRDCAGASASL